MLESKYVSLPFAVKVCNATIWRNLKAFILSAIPFFDGNKDLFGKNKTENSFTSISCAIDFFVYDAYKLHPTAILVQQHHCKKNSGNLRKQV